MRLSLGGREDVSWSATVAQIPTWESSLRSVASDGFTTAETTMPGTGEFFNNETDAQLSHQSTASLLANSHLN